MFDSPFDRCPVCNEMVLLDQTQKECAREHGCRNVDCPLGRYFVGVDFSSGARATSRPRSFGRSGHGKGGAA